MRNIKTTGGDISTQQDTSFRLYKLEKRCSPFALIDPSTNLEAAYLDVPKELRVELCRFASGEKHHDLLFRVEPLQEGEQENQPLRTRHDAVALLQAFIRNLQFFQFPQQKMIKKTCLQE